MLLIAQVTGPNSPDWRRGALRRYVLYTSWQLIPGGYHGGVFKRPTEGVTYTGKPVSTAGGDAGPEKGVLVWGPKCRESRWA